MKTTTLLLAAASSLAPLASTTPLDSPSCGPTLQTCNPSTATTATLPALGPDFSTVYLSLLSAVKGINFRRRSASSSSSVSPSFCCAPTTSCLTLSLTSAIIPFCYDKFTTNYIFPDGSSGTLATGLYSAADGSGAANLLTGEFNTSSSSSSSSSAVSATAAAGAADNIYAANPDDRPDTATLSIPPQYTAAGVGSAIPVTELGTVVVSASATGTGSASATGTGAATTTTTTEGSRTAAAASARCL